MQTFIGPVGVNTIGVREPRFKTAADSKLSKPAQANFSPMISKSSSGVQDLWSLSALLYVKAEEKIEQPETAEKSSLLNSAQSNKLLKLTLSLVLLFMEEQIEEILKQNRETQADKEKISKDLNLCKGKLDKAVQQLSKLKQECQDGIQDSACKEIEFDELLDSCQKLINKIDGELIKFEKEAEN